jgi:hypothetical protein
MEDGATLDAMRREFTCGSKYRRPVDAMLGEVDRCDLKNSAAFRC